MYRNWDEQRVGDWLVSINCGQYVEIFKSKLFPALGMLSVRQG